MNIYILIFTLLLLMVPISAKLFKHPQWGPIPYWCTFIGANFFLGLIYTKTRNPGILLLVIGFIMNWVVMFVNNYRMPSLGIHTPRDSWEPVTPNTRLVWLADISSIRGHHASKGDFVIAVGLLVTGIIFLGSWLF